ncbi:hypothetical protein OAN24_00200 [Pseudodesulfovibrio sp.]|nr:hypothetical protein [Pseudodesulfovibrio sp.]
MKIRIIMALVLTLMATSAFAWDRGDRLEKYYDHKGDEIARQYDAKGDRINTYYDRLALEAALQGNFGQALKLDAKGDRLDAQLDAKGARINKVLDRKGRKIGHSLDMRAASHHSSLKHRWRYRH